jgi:Mce-associated membrane protein
VLDAQQSDDAGQGVESGPPISLTEAEEAVSRAEARAEEARARAEQLRRQAAASARDEYDPDDASDVGVAADTADDGDNDETEASGTSLARLRRSLRGLQSRVRPPRQTTVGVGAAVVICAASLGASGYMLWQHISLMHEHKRAAEFTTAARAGVELMMSIDPDHARENVQRLIDNTTGVMQTQLRATSTLLVEDAQKAKVTTKATAQDIAVESMTDNSAVVLVLAQSDTTNPDKSKRPPAYWRLSVGLTRDGGQIKMSKVDFVE